MTEKLTEEQLKAKRDAYYESLALKCKRILTNEKCIKKADNYIMDRMSRDDLCIVLGIDDCDLRPMKEMAWAIGIDICSDTKGYFLGRGIDHVVNVTSNMARGDGCNRAASAAIVASSKDMMHWEDFRKVLVAETGMEPKKLIEHLKKRGAALPSELATAMLAAEAESVKGI